jgi:hypothetical protein
VSLGAVNVVGQGPTELLKGATPDRVPEDGLWSVTIESDVGWYVILSQDCDIVRDKVDDPCLLVCPLTCVSDQRWMALRHGPYSPREFPFPDAKIAGQGNDGKPVANLRFVTSVDKEALLDDSVKTLRPLSAPQRDRFQAWAGRRFMRAAFDDALNEDVLAPSATVLLGYLSKARADLEGGRTPNASGIFMCCAEEWMVGGTDRLVSLNAITTEAAMASVGATREVVESGRAFVEGKLRAKLPAGKGYGLELVLWTLDSMPASRYRDLAPWVIESAEDRLGAW